MLIEFDPPKDMTNREKHGISLSAAESINWETALIRVDNRKHYAEDRFQALGLLEARLYLVVFTVRGDALRIISLRKANKREIKQYEQA